MIITVDRFISDSDTTLSNVLVDGRWQCFGLEDEYRENKVPGETRIPAGTYTVGLRKGGGFNARYARRYASAHQGMLQALDVPGFEYILIHSGNTDQDTAGCLLVGAGAMATYGNMSLLHSRDAYWKLYRSVIDAALADTLRIGFEDNDR